VTPETPSPSELGRTVQEVTELAQKIIREEIELAKAEVAEKVSKLAKGAAVGAAAGVFVIFGLVYLFHAAAWGFWLATGTDNSFWLGFLFVAVLLFVLAGVAGFLALRFVRGGGPPTPQMAIDEAQKVRETLTESRRS